MSSKQRDHCGDQEPLRRRRARPEAPDAEPGDIQQAPTLDRSLHLRGPLAPAVVLHLQGILGNRRLQRVVELRTPGRGEVSARGRLPDLVERLNRQSSAIQYRLEGRILRCNVVDRGALTNFDRQMEGFIGGTEVIPMRMITSAGMVDEEYVFLDYLDAGYVDLDDLLASDDLSFRMNMVHILAERSAVRNYARRIGTTFTAAEVRRAHRAGVAAEAEHLRDVFGDPTIRYVGERTTFRGGDVFIFRSRQGYRIIHLFARGSQAAVRGGQVFVRTRDNRRLTIDQFRAERVAASA